MRSCAPSLRLVRLLPETPAEYLKPLAEFKCRLLHRLCVSASETPAPHQSSLETGMTTEWASVPRSVKDFNPRWTPLAVAPNVDCISPGRMQSSEPAVGIGILLCAGLMEPPHIVNHGGPQRWLQGAAARRGGCRRGWQSPPPPGVAEAPRGARGPTDADAFGAGSSQFLL